MEQDLSARKDNSDKVRLYSLSLSLREKRAALREARDFHPTKREQRLSPGLSPAAADRINQDVANGRYDQAMTVASILGPDAAHMRARNMAEKGADVKPQTPIEQATQIIEARDAYKQRIQRMRSMGQRSGLRDHAAVAALNTDLWMLQEPTTGKRWGIHGTKLGLTGAAAYEVYEEFANVRDNLGAGKDSIGDAATQAGEAIKIAANLGNALPDAPKVDFSGAPGILNLGDYPNYIIRLFEQLIAPFEQYPHKLGEYAATIGTHNANAITDIGDSIGHMGNAIQGVVPLMLWTIGATLFITWLKPLKLSADTTAEMLPPGIKGGMDMVSGLVKSLAAEVDAEFELQAACRRESTLPSISPIVKPVTVEAKPSPQKATKNEK